jgi:penicillin-binding protein 2
LKNLSEEKQEYVNYIYSMLKENEILVTASINEEDETYQNWKEEKISLRGFLRYAINNEWIDISSFDIKSDYYSADEIYEELMNYIIETLKTDESFDKILYKYMIKTNALSGKKICLLLFDQGVLNKKKDAEYDALSQDQMSAYNFMYKKIYNLEITPAQLALDPCSGSIIITDPDTGAVKAMVSYPSYDNNKLANGIDAVYYASLNKDKSSPMLNRCTQMRTAPGSTFKPISSTAALEEGILDAGDYLKCTGIFDKITPSPKCWIYPNAHGSLNVSGAIAVSCNNFFYQVGYELGSTNGNYNSEKGLERLAKYAKLYGLNKKSGVEITEYEPKISDEDAVRSAIGQGTHSYTPSQIARYLTSLVNEKELVNLSLLDKTTDAQGNVLTEYEKTTEGKLDVSDSTFDLIKKGMKNVVNGPDSSIKYLYKKQGLKVAGKTGTAQENKNRPNHALFISYAPYDDPEIAMTVVVPNGYTSSNAAEIARDVYKYYFNKTSKEEEKAKTALLPTGNDSSND